MATNKDDWDPPREASTFDTREEGGGTKKDTAKFKTNVLQLLYCILKRQGQTCCLLVLVVPVSC